MAPTTKSGKRASIRSRAAAKSKPVTYEQLSAAFTENNNPDDDEEEQSPTIHLTTKRQKRDARATTFRTQITQSTTPRSGINKNTRRRAKKRTNTTLTANLNALADALPVHTDNSAMLEKLGGVNVVKSRSGNVAIDGREVKKMKTLSTRPGMNRRRDKLLKSESERFGRNMAVMLKEGSGFREDSEKKNGDVGGGGTKSAAAGLRALRGFVTQSLAVQNAMK